MKTRFLPMIVVMVFALAFGGAQASQASSTITWSIEIVDAQDEVGWWNSIKTDSLGHPHISYSHPAYWPWLKYAHYDGATWRIEQIDNVGSTSDIALDKDGKPHVSYYDDNNNWLKYAYRDSAGWHTQVVDADPQDAGVYTSLALDSNGYPHIAYMGHYILPPHNVKYAYFDGATWHKELVDGDGHLGFVISLDLDSNNRPHVMYYDYDRRMMKYAYHNGNEWKTSFVAQSVSGFLKLDKNNRPAVSLVSESHLKYGYFDGAQWNFQVVDDNIDSGPYAPETALDFDTKGNPHIAYQDNTTAMVKYAYSDGSAWHIQDVAPGCTVIPNSDCSLSLSIDARGQPHISFNNAVERKLRYAIGRKLFNFSGFFPPVENLPKVNKQTAGQAIPLKFSLRGYEGLDIIAAGYPASAQNPCGATAENIVALTTSPGNSSLSYDAVTDQYTYVWKTDRSWAGTCRTLVLKLVDGMSYKASFEFK